MSSKREQSSSADDDILLPLVEKIRERVNKGELQEKYLAIAEYMTDPLAPFPIKDRNLPEFFESMRRDAIAANKPKAG